MTAKRISVVHLLHSIAYGGVESAVLNWAERLDRDRFAVHVVCFANPGGTEAPFVAEARRRGLSVDTIPWGRRKPLWKSARALARLFERHGTHIVHSHNCYADCVAAIAGRLSGVRTVTTVYVWTDYGWKRRMIDRVQEVAIRTFDQVTVHCRDTFDKTAARGFPAASLKTLICGFDLHPLNLTPEARLAARAALGVGPDATLLGNVARFYPEKKQDLLLRAFRQILDVRPNTYLAIVGVGPLERELRSLSETLGLDQRVRFLGWVDDVQRVLPLFDIHVHPALSEGVSLAIGEGMAAARPLVASAVGGLFEILEDGRTAILIPPGPRETERFAEAVLGLMADPSEARRLGGAARDFILKHYTLGYATTLVEDAYVALIARRPIGAATTEGLRC